jgi:hypothetical protein
MVIAGTNGAPEVPELVIRLYILLKLSYANVHTVTTIASAVCLEPESSLEFQQSKVVQVTFDDGYDSVNELKKKNQKITQRPGARLLTPGR